MWGREKGIRTPEFNKKLEKQRKIKLAFIFIILLIAIIAPIYILRMERFLIKAIEIEGNSLTKNEDIQKVVLDNLEGNFFLLFPKSNALLYDKEKIISDLNTNFPRLKNAEVSLINSQTLKISVSERSPFALYCVNIIDPNNPDDCYFLDDEGYIFSKAPSFSGEVYSVYSSLPPSEDPSRKQLIEPILFKKAHAFLKALPEINIYPRVFVVKEDEFHIIFSNNAVVMLKEDAELDEVYSNLKAFLEDKENPKSLNNMQYVDLRFGNKIFYKLKEVEVPVEEIYPTPADLPLGTTTETTNE